MLPTMTANEPNSTESENSIPPEIEGTEYASVNDPVCERIVLLASDNGWIMRRDIAFKTGWSLEKIDDHVEHLKTDNLVELIGKSGRQTVVLTKRGHRVAGRQECL